MENMETTQNQAELTDQTTQAAVQATEATQQPTQAPEAPEVDFKVADDAPESKPKALEPWMQERLDREKRKADRERSARETAERRIQELERQYANHGYVTPQQQAPQEQDPMALLKSVVKETLAETEKEKSERQAQETEARREQELAAKLKRGFDKYEDFETTLGDPSLPITARMKEYAETLPDPEDFLYNLARYNPDKLQAVAKMHPAVQSVQLHELYKAFSQKKHRQATSKAPAPPDAVDSDVVADKSLQKLSYDELRKITRPQKLR